MDPSTEPVLFEETQSFRQWWLWALLVPAALIPLAVFGYGFYQQLILGRPWGNRPMSDGALIACGAGVMAVSVGVLALLITLRLTVRLERDRLRIEFGVLKRREIATSDIVKYEVRTYSPLREYGGWGIRYGRGGSAYNVSGDRGVQLELSDGTRLLIGSQRADELAQAIAHAKGK